MYTILVWTESLLGMRIAGVFLHKRAREARQQDLFVFQE